MPSSVGARLTDLARWVDSRIVLSFLVGQVSWGDVPAWVLGGAALLAFVLAVRAAHLRHEELRTSERRLAALEEDRWRDQASRVAAWASEVSLDPPPGDLAFVAEPDAAVPHEVVIACHNGSGEPVYDLKVGVYGDDGNLWEPAPLSLLPPETTRHIRISVPLALRRGGEQEELPAVRVIFRDARGRSWARTRRGRLTGIEHPPAQRPPDKPPPDEPPASV